LEIFTRKDTLSMTTSTATRIVVSSDVMFRNVGDESVLLHLGSETYMGLDSVGTRMWALLTESGSVDAAYDALLNEYEVNADQLRHDLEQFVAKLLENKLIENSAA
jgi:hypothetical protein